MNEETMNNENYVEEYEADTEVEVYEEPETSNGGFIKKLVIGGIIAGGAALVVANREKIAKKIDAWKIKSLTKKGYEISDPVFRAESETVIEHEEVCEDEIIED